MRKKIDQGTSRRMNRRLILNLLRQEGAMPRSEIAFRTGLSSAAVTFVVSDLVSENILLEGETTKGAAGRRPIPININYAAHHAIGVKLMVDTIECVLTDLATNVLYSFRLNLPDQSPESVVAVCVQCVEHVLENANVPNVDLMGIGIAVPGIIDTESGVCRRSHRFKWTNVALAKMVRDRVNVPVWLDDDTNAFGLAQMLFGSGRQHRTVGALAIGAGISCALIINGSLHHGSNGAAGKLGHIRYKGSETVCECGQVGCLQTYFSEPALVARWRKLEGLGTQVTRYDLLEAATAGKESALQILTEAGEVVGEYLASFCNIVDPEIIVVGGEAVSFGDFLFAPLRASLKKHALWTPPPLKLDWDGDSWAQGAAALATQHLFDFEVEAGTESSVAIEK